MGHNQSTPNSIDYTSNPHLPQDLNNRLNALQYNNSALNHTEQPTMKKSSSLIEYVPIKEKQLFRDDMSCSYNDYSEARISSTTLKTKRSSTVKLCLMSQDRRRSEDFDMGQMEENTDVLKKNSNFSENNPCLDSSLSPNNVVLRTRRKNINRHPKSSSFFLSSSQNSSVVYQNSVKPEPKAIGPHFSDKVGERLPGKDVDEDVDVVLKTETNERDIEHVDAIHKEIHYTESSLCRMESVGCPVIVDKYKESKHVDDEVRILETCGSRLSSPGHVPTNRYSPELHLDLSRKKSSIKKEENRYASRPIMIASFEGDHIGSYRVKDSDIMSLSSSEADHGEGSHMYDIHRNYSPEKTQKSFKSLNRKDGDYQVALIFMNKISKSMKEVEFSFKPNSVSKGSRRYTTEGDVVVEPRYHFMEERKKTEHNNEEDLDNENPLIKNLHFNSLEFACLQPSVENVANKLSPCKSSTNNVFRDFENTRYTHDKEAEVLMESKTLTTLTPTILLDSKKLPFVDTTKDVSKASQIRGESTSVLCSVTDFENKAIVSEIIMPNRGNNTLLSSVKYDKEESVVYDKEVLTEKTDEKENRPAPANPNFYKLQQITKSDTLVTDNALSPAVFPVGRILQNMKKGIKVQIQKADNTNTTTSFSKTKNFYQCQISASDKCNSFSKEASANSSSFLRVLKDNDNIPRMLPNKVSQGYGIREDCTGLIPDKRPSLGSAKLRPRAGIYSNESQSSFNIDDSISRLERRRKSELNNSRFQRGGPVRSHNKTLTQETFCVSTATSGNEVSMTSVKLTKQHSKIELNAECDQTMKKVNKATRSVTSSRASVERNTHTPTLKNQPKKGLKDLVSNRENQVLEEPLYTLILPLTSPKEIDFSRRTTKGDIEQRKKSISSQQTKLNKTASRVVLGKEEYSQGERAAKTPTCQKKQWGSDKEMSALRPRSAMSQNKSEAKLNKTLDVSGRDTSNMKDDKNNEKSQSSKILKNLLRGGQMDKSQKKGVATDKSDIKSKLMNRTLNLQEKSEAKSPYLKKR